MIGKSVLVVFAFLCGLGVEARFTHRQTTEEEEDGTFEEDHIFISPKCAAVIISGGALGGAGLAYAITPALCTAGFCQAGVTQSSFASWWQSTMPLIKGGSLFATLQSIAMGGVGTNVVVSGSVLGGTVGMPYVTQFCAYVDDPNSSMAPAFDATLAAVKNAKSVADKATAACLSSESCTAAADFAQATSETLSSSVSSIWSYIQDGVGQTTKAISNKVEVWALEEKAETLKKKIQHMKHDNYSGKIIEHVRHSNNWSRTVVNWLSGGVVESIFNLEKELMDTEARLIELKQEAAQ